MTEISLIIDRVFRAYMKKAGQRTFFEEKFETGELKHVVESNFDRWKIKIEKVKTGNAVLNIEFWNGAPYASKKTLVKSIKDADIQKLELKNGKYLIDGKEVSFEALAKNSGMTPEDFSDCFKVMSSTPMAVIQINNFKY